MTDTKKEEPREKSYTFPEAEIMIKAALDKAKVGYTRITVNKDEILLVLLGDPGKVGDVVKKLIIPGVFGVEGVKSIKDVVDVTERKDPFNNILDTTVKLSRKFCKKIYEE